MAVGCELEMEAEGWMGDGTVRTHPQDCLGATGILNELSLTSGCISRGAPTGDVLKGNETIISITEFYNCFQISNWSVWIKAITLQWCVPFSDSQCLLCTVTTHYSLIASDHPTQSRKQEITEPQAATLPHWG